MPADRDAETSLTLLERLQKNPDDPQAWNLFIERVLGKNYLLDVGYVGNKGTRLPRMIETNPSVYGPDVNPNNIDQHRIYAGCPGTPGPCDFGSVGLITNVVNSTYHSGQISMSRHFAAGGGHNDRSHDQTGNGSQGNP